MITCMVNRTLIRGDDELNSKRSCNGAEKACVFLKSLDRFLLVKLISLLNYLVPY